MHSHSVWQYLVWPGTVIPASWTRNTCYPACWQLVTERVLLSFLYAWNINCVFLQRNMWQWYVNSIFLSKWAFRQFYFHASKRQSYVQSNLSCQSQWKQTSFVSYMILNLHGNETRNSCDQRFFFSWHFERKLGKKKNLRHLGYIGEKRCRTNSILLFCGLQKLCRHCWYGSFSFYFN